jgi:hypothetical protein
MILNLHIRMAKAMFGEKSCNLMEISFVISLNAFLSYFFSQVLNKK